MSIKVGDIVHVYIDDINLSKNKYAVCIQTFENWVLLVNTQNRDLYDCVEISSSDYKFLNNKNRYVSCSRIFELPSKKLEKIKIYDKLHENDLRKIYDKVKFSKRLSRIQKQRILCF